MADKAVIIDTSILIDYFRKSDRSKSVLFSLFRNFDRFFITSITEYEVYAGITDAQAKFWQDLFSEMIVLPFDSNSAQIAAEVIQELKRKRKNTDKADLFIASIAVANSLPLATLNRKHFESIGQLTLADL